MTGAILAVLLLVIPAGRVPVPARADVTAKNGNYFVGYTDLVDPADPGLKVSRFYNSKSPYVGMFGLGWGYPWASFIDSGGTLHEWGGGQTVTSPALVSEGALRVFTSADGTKEAFDSQGLLVQLRDGKTTYTVTRDANGLVTSVADSAGHSITYSWGAPGRVLTASGAGGQAQYGYDDTGLLVYVRQADGTIYYYTYDGAGRGNLIRIEFADGTSEEIDYYGFDLNENVRLVKERDGRTTLYDYNWDKANPGFSRVEVISAASPSGLNSASATRKTLQFESPEHGARPSWGAPKPRMHRVGVLSLTRPSDGAGVPEVTPEPGYSGSRAVWLLGSGLLLVGGVLVFAWAVSRKR